MQPDDVFIRLKALVQRKSLGLTTYGENEELESLVEQLGQMFSKATLRLDESERRIRTMMEAIPVGLLIVSESGQIQAANQACLRLFHSNHEAIGAKRLSEMFSDKDGPFQLTVPDAAQDGSPLQLTANRCDGSQFPAELSNRSFVVGGNQMRLIAVQDVTARQELEDMKESFVSMLSHDLRTPLSSIQAFVELLAAGTYDHDLGLMRAKARGVESDIDRLIGMINTLLDVYKLEAGRLEMFFDVVPIKTLVNRSVQSLSALAEKKDVRIEVEAIPSALHVKADPDYVVQVIVNLLSNAIKFSPAGEAVRVSVCSDDSFLKTSVTDRGVGIRADAQAKLFNRFEQVNVSDARLKGGTGLGLAFARAIVEQHGGKIGVNSEEGQGSTFWFTLPEISLDMPI